ncbi:MULTISPECIES: DUF2786 domain-containing protein [unclassified Microbacterium]|uniref:DUF2786 domain-containing protein n=1 Tax=unclassified Microbacterium TaxID=2609290 RepID=UPI00288354AE|nr:MULTISPECIES: DUF2786 domain-containing protein [unclassified Microbacterium]
MSESKLDLIAKMLAKAESTTPEEAEALTEHAERLMLKYGIEQARIDERRAKLGQSQEQIVQETQLFTGVYARDLREMGGQVTFALGTLRPLQKDVAGLGSILYIVGFESDVRQARLLIASLEVQAMVAMRAWWRANRPLFRYSSESEKRRARSGFIRGFGAGASARIRRNRQTIVEDAGSGTDLVLSSRRDRVDAVVDEKKHPKARTRKPADELTYAEGVRAGYEANTGEKNLTAGRALESHSDEDAA